MRKSAAKILKSVLNEEGNAEKLYSGGKKSTYSLPISASKPEPAKEYAWSYFVICQATPTITL